MRIQTREEAPATILDLDGRLTAGGGAALLTETVGTLLARGSTNMVLNMEHVDLVDCAGIGQLVDCYSKASQQGGRLTLANVDRRLGDLLRLFHLERFLEVFSTERAAVASVAAGHIRPTERPLESSRPGANRRASLISMSQSQGAI